MHSEEPVPQGFLSVFWWPCLPSPSLSTPNPDGPQPCTSWLGLAVPGIPGKLSAPYLTPRPGEGGGAPGRPPPGPLSPPSLQSCFAVMLGGPQETGQLLEHKFDYIFFTGESLLRVAGLGAGMAGRGARATSPQGSRP